MSYSIFTCYMGGKQWKKRDKSTFLYWERSQFIPLFVVFLILIHYNRLLRNIDGQFPRCTICLPQLESCFLYYQNRLAWLDIRFPRILFPPVPLDIFQNRLQVLIYLLKNSYLQARGVVPPPRQKRIQRKSKACKLYDLQAFVFFINQFNLVYLFTENKRNKVFMNASHFNKIENYSVNQIIFYFWFSNSRSAQ